MTVGAGGIYTEFLAKAFRPGQDVALFSPALADAGLVEAALQQVAVVQLATRSMRGQAPLLPLGRIADLAAAFLELGRALGHRIAEFEVNPFVDRERRPRGGPRRPAEAAPRAGRRPGARRGPSPSSARLLEPRSVAIMGVSERMNPGHIIVNNLLREGFARDRIVIVKGGTAEIEGCRCVPDIAAIPDRVDLFVLCVDAAQASAALVEIIEREKAESVVLIPGGLEEKAGSEAIVARMHAALAQSRGSAWGGPVINGGNCLGIRSVPGRYDTTFIPEYKLPVPKGEPSRLAIISQSGAFAVSKASKLGTVNPKYSVTLGNQMDLTVGDYLTYLKDDAGIDVFAVYVEGFRPLDGLRFLQAAREITSQGRTVILLQGRPDAGGRAGLGQPHGVDCRRLHGHAGPVRECRRGRGRIARRLRGSRRALLEARPARRVRLAAGGRVQCRIRMRGDRRQPRPLHAAAVRRRRRPDARGDLRAQPDRQGRRRPQSDRPHADDRRRGVRRHRAGAARRRTASTRWWSGSCR